MSENVKDKEIKTAVIGHPIGHSKSPKIHNYWIEKYGLRGRYDAVDISCENLKSGIDKLIADGYAGFNVTIPHKEEVLELCDTLDPFAKACGAVNTVVIENGKLHGFNTDAFGFLTNIKQQQPAFDFKAGPAVVLGAGGASRAIIYGLMEEGAPQIILSNRSRAKAEKIISELDPKGARITLRPWEERHEALSGANALVNTTSLGMNGQPALELDLEKLPKTALVTDIVYSPLETDLLKRAAARGNPVVTGIGMLLHQARPGFEKWRGVMPDVDAALEKLVLS